MKQKQIVRGFSPVLIVVAGAIALATFIIIMSATRAKAQDCGISTRAIWSHCEYVNPDDPEAAPNWREYGEDCRNGDELVLQSWLQPSCWMETGVITVTAMHPEYGYDTVWLTRPANVSFLGLRMKYVTVRLRGIYAWSSNGSDPVYIPVRVIPVSSRNAAIVDDSLIFVQWRPTVVTGDGGGKGLTAPSGRTATNAAPPSVRR